MNWVDIILVLFIAAAIGLALGHLIRHKGQGCGGSCGSCPYGGRCGKKTD